MVPPRRLHFQSKQMLRDALTDAKRETAVQRACAAVWHHHADELAKDFAATRVALEAALAESQRLSARLACPICLEEIQRPMVYACGHMVCRTCHDAQWSVYQDSWHDWRQAGSDEERRPIYPKCCKCRGETTHPTRAFLG